VKFKLPLRNPLSDGAVFAIALLALSWGLICFDTLGRWDQLVYDAELRFFSRPANQEIAIIAIDEYSLQRLGRWPWSRRIHADLIDKLTAAGVKAIGLDVIFAEPDASDPEADERLAQSLRRSGRVVLPVLPERSSVTSGLSATLPLPGLAASAAGLGHVDIELDEDGIARSVYLKAGIDSPTWSFFALAMLEAAKTDTRNSLSGERSPRSTLNDSSHFWKRDYLIHIPFCGPSEHFPRFSYAEVLNDETVAPGLRDKYVLVGATAAGLGVTLATPAPGRTASMSGIEFNAQVLDTLLQGLAVRKLQLGWSLLLTAALVLCPVFAFNFLPLRWTLPVTVLFSLLAVAISVIWFRVFLLWYPPTAAVLTLSLGYPFWSWRRLELAVKALHEEKERASATLNSIGDAVIATDAVGIVQYMNPVAETLTGYDLQQVQGRHIDAVLTVRTSQTQAAIGFKGFARYLKSGRAVKLTDPHFLKSHLGKECAVRISANPIREPSGKIRGMVLGLSDITETLRITRQMAYLATHDNLTQLPNRNLFEDRLAQAIANAQRQRLQFAVIFIDLDGFKKINDGMGHAVGDMLLTEVARRLRTHVRQSDTAARWGGDEFVLLVERLADKAAAAEIAHKMVGALSQPFDFKGQELYVTPSIGISLFPGDGTEAETLLMRADAAMYQVKQSGGNNFRFYSEDINDWAAERLVLEKEMHYALRRGDFEVFYQPQIEPHSRRIIGAEALIRWRHPEKGLIAPAKFVPLAEETGLINPLGKWIIQSVCQQIKAWQMGNIPATCVAVNLSPRQFLQSDLFDQIAGALDGTGINPALLKFEITESLVMKDVERVAATLRDIRRLGVKVSIDDFGTGYSSLSFLQRFPIDQLKIDQSFVRQVASNTDDAAIAQAIIVLARSLRMKVIAEGVETRSQMLFFKDRNCDGIQGHYYCPALPASDMTRLLGRTGGVFAADRANN
jgi:diguanylate cyclase (GGDEF)-like protein/PAS domain S-box-containing protein